MLKLHFNQIVFSLCSRVSWFWSIFAWFQNANMTFELIFTHLESNSVLRSSWEVLFDLCLTVIYVVCDRAEQKIKHCRIRNEDRLFTIGSACFESLIELVQYYRTNPLYRKMKLRYAVTEQLLKEQGIVSFMSLFTLELCPVQSTVVET